MNQVTIKEAKQVYALRELSDSTLQWIIDHSDYVEYNDRQNLVKKGEPIDTMWMILDGTVDFYMDINGRQVYYFTFENSETTGGVSGLLPYSRMKVSPGYSYANGQVRTLRMHKKHFQELEKLDQNFIQKLIAYMTDRARAFATMQLQQEKVSALGKLAAGIAHELNNPAAAINRIANEMTTLLNKSMSITTNMLVEQVDAMSFEIWKERLLEKKNTEFKKRPSALQLLEEEDRLRDWLNELSIQQADDLAATFVESGIRLEDLMEIKEDVPKKSLDIALSWYANRLQAQRMIRDLGKASERISSLVGAIKSHVHMDRTDGLQQTNLIEDIENTLTILGHKINEKSITVTKNYSEELQLVDAFVGELNQVWMNILDNAIYAMDKNGRLTIDIFLKNNDIKVFITDTGTGIPQEILPRIFEPFFTTKKVGQGTGIGLDIVSRVIKRHKGDIKVYSKPGETRFEVCLPVKQGGVDSEN